MTTRREFTTLLGGAAAWPLATQAQQPAKLRSPALGTKSCLTEPASERAGREARIAEGTLDLAKTFYLTPAHAKEASNG
jgi:hypothetical protein